MKVEDLPHTLIFCPCGSHRVDYDSERNRWTCEDCRSTITQEAVEKIAGGSDQPQGPLELLP